MIHVHPFKVDLHNSRYSPEAKNSSSEVEAPLSGIATTVIYDLILVIA